MRQQHGFLKSSQLVHAIVACADAALQANKAEQIAVLTEFLKIDYGLFDVMHNFCTAYGKCLVAGAHGVVAGLGDAVHAVVHLDQTIIGMAKSVYYVLETAALNDIRVGMICSQDLQTQRDQRNKEIRQGLAILTDQFTKSTPPEKLEALTRFCTDWCVSGKIMHGVGATLGLVRSQARNLRTLEAATQMLGEDQALHKVAAEIGEIEQTVAKYDGVVQEKLAEKVADVAKNMPKSCKIWTLEKTVAEWKQCGGKISQNNAVLKNNMEYWLQQFIKDTHITIEQAILDECKNIKQLVGNIEMQTCIDIEHIANPQLKLVLDKSGTYYQMQFDGGHLAGTARKLEQAGFIKIKSYEKFANGCIEYQLQYPYSNASFIHTEFAPHWTVERIVQETKIAFTQLISEHATSPNFADTVKIIDSFDLRIVVNSNPKNHTCMNNQHVITAHPIYERKIK